MKISNEVWKKAEAFLTNRPLENRAVEKLDYIGGIVGGDKPSGYSSSPVLWNRFFQELGLKAFFSALDLPQEQPFGGFAEAFLSLPGCLDLTVTSPYKATAYESLSSLSFKVTVTDHVRHHGCHNHIIINPATGEAYVDLTDGWGMVRALKKRRVLKGARVLLVGAGGAASAIGYELAREGADLVIANIVEEDAAALASRLRPHLAPSGSVAACGWNNIIAEAPQSDVIVSAISASTPLDRAGVEALADGCLLADTR
ncbi:MAG TPA: hypothetical protein VMX75_09555, partial [Spirochaetia bacterium]|nr:hypothetical protein [Spirochaetia bacterium]